MSKNIIKKGLVGGMLVLATIGASTLYANSGENKIFNVLTYNVAGLPGILSSSDPVKNTSQISPLLNDYAVIAVQEDFAYHSQLISQVVHPYLSEHSGNVPRGDGMNFLSKYPLQDIQRIKWDKTYGIINNGSDQLTPKGFAYTKLKLEEGVYVDVYTLHTDADIDEGSLAARQANMSQLARYIKVNSEGNAVIVMGDTNSRYTRAGDNFETALLEPCGLTDAWIELMRNGDVPQDGDALMDQGNKNSGLNEVVDKIFYRSNDNIHLQAVNYCLDEKTFMDVNGNQLSDHYPLTVSFEYTVDDDIVYSKSNGGSGGDAFNFLGKMNLRKASIQKIGLRSGNRIDRLSLTYTDNTTLNVGGNGGSLKELTLEEGEYITSMTVGKTTKNGSERVGYLDIETSLGHHLTGGTYTTDAITLTTPNGYKVIGFWGRAATEIDQLGTIYQKQ